MTQDNKETLHSQEIKKATNDILFASMANYPANTFEALVVNTLKELAAALTEGEDKWCVACSQQVSAKDLIYSIKTEEKIPCCPVCRNPVFDIPEQRTDKQQIAEDAYTQKFRKKPVVIEAVQFTEKNKDMVYNWAREVQGNISHTFNNGTPALVIPTLEGEMMCDIGDYLIKEPFPTDWRKLYPCKPDIFEKTYELVNV